MKKSVAVVVACISLAACGGDPPVTGPDNSTQQAFVVFDSAGALGAGLDIFVNTDKGITDWLGAPSDGRLATYPSGQQFGFVGAVVAGNPNPGSRPLKDMTAYRTLQFELRGAVGGEVVEVGIKDNLDPDDGSETKIALTLTQAWTPYSYPLTSFASANLSRIYLLFELVLNGPSGRSVYFRNVRYTP
jgi:hypothetical protein